MSFIEFVIERIQIWVKRRQNIVPLTQDKVLQKYFFCNIFREYDRGTIHLIKNVINNKDLSYKDKVLNCVIYRLINNKYLYDQIPVAKVNSYDPIEYGKNFDNFKGPLWGPAYRTKGPIAYVCESANILTQTELNTTSLQTDERYLTELRKIRGIGNFIAYQISLDLAYCTSTSFTVYDILYVGPGSFSELKDTYGKLKNIHIAKDIIIYLTNLLNDNLFFFHREFANSDIEHALCEYRKYKNFYDGKGRKRLFYSNLTKKSVPPGDIEGL